MNKKDFLVILKKYKPNNVEFGKDLEYLCFRNNCTKEELIKEILSLDNLSFVIEQKRQGEDRFVLYFIYHKSKGRVYVLRFYPEKIRIVTIFPIGKRTLNKYFKQKFKKEEKP